MNINRFYKKPVIEAVELFAAGWCNLNCKYCYIPKTDFLKKIHKNIINDIESGKMLEDLKDVFGNELTSIAHWGTEPTLTIKKFKFFYEEAIKTFPNLKDISFSSNFMTNPGNIIEFVSNLPKIRPLNLTFQVSLDGPPEITDENRQGGAAAQIMKNCLIATEEFNKHNTYHKIFMHLKPTAGAEGIEFLSKMQNIDHYYKFFDEFMTKWLEVGSNINIARICDPTIVLPGDYTTEDGVNFYRLLLNQLELKNTKYKSIEKPESNYYNRWKNKFNFYKEYYIKQKMFTCSSGDSMIGLGDKSKSIHACHRTFYADHDEYIEAAKEHGLDKQTMIGLESGRNGILVDTNITNIDDDTHLLKVLFTKRAYNDFVKHKSSVGVSIAIELAKCGQISKCYTNIDLALLLSYIVQTTDCPMDNVVVNGTTLIPQIGVFRLFGNGAFENILSRILKS